MSSTRTTNSAGFHKWKPAEFVVRVEDITEHVANEFRGVGPGVERQLARFMAKTQRPQVVDSENVIGVGVSVEHGIKMGDALADCLLVKIRCAVDEHHATVVFNQNRRSSTAVVGIGGMADRAVAANGGHAHGRAAAQDGQRGLHLFAESVPVAWGGRASAFVTST